MFATARETQRDRVSEGLLPLWDRIQALNESFIEAVGQQELGGDLVDKSASQLKYEQLRWEYLMAARSFEASSYPPEHRDEVLEVFRERDDALAAFKQRQTQLFGSVAGLLGGAMMSGKLVPEDYPGRDKLLALDEEMEEVAATFEAKLARLRETRSLPGPQ